MDVGDEADGQSRERIGKAAHRQVGPCDADGVALIGEAVRTAADQGTGAGGEQALQQCATGDGPGARLGASVGSSNDRHRLI